jgi:hypothetical protein
MLAAYYQIVLYMQSQPRTVNFELIANRRSQCIALNTTANRQRTRDGDRDVARLARLCFTPCLDRKLQLQAQSTR